MANPVRLQDEFVRMVRDKSRDQLRENECWNLVDFVPNLGAPLGKRGGWEYHGSALTSMDAGADAPIRVAYAPFSAGAQVIAIDDSAELFDITNSVDRGAALVPYASPVFYRNLLIIPSAAGTAAPKKYTGSGAPAALGGSPPNAALGAVYKDRLMLAAASATPNRIYFSAAANPESWDTTNRYIDTSAPITGLISLRNAVLVLHAGSVERIRGSIPPGSAAANMELEPLFDDIGMTSPCAFAVSNDQAYFADENGVYQTDGATPTNLTELGGISRYWRDQYDAVGVPTGTVSMAVWRGYLFVSMKSSGGYGTYVDFLVCELRTRSWFRFKNIIAEQFAVEFGANDELYFANRDDTNLQVGKLSAVFDPSSSVALDANDVPVEPSLGTRFFYLGSMGSKRMRKLYVNYHLDYIDSGSQPALRTSVVLDPEEAGGTPTLSPDLAANTIATRQPILVNRRGQGVAFNIDQISAGSATTSIFGLELESYPLEGSKRG